jgi:hypothetical protein
MMEVGASILTEFERTVIAEQKEKQFPILLKMA